MVPQVHPEPMRPTRRPPALADAAFDQLRADLLAGGPLTSRRRLVAGALARRLGMSRTPVREALDRLARLGFLTPLEGGGYERRRYRHRDIKDVYELRLLLEPVAAKLAATAGRSVASSTHLGRPFHRRVADASGNRVLAHVMELLAERVAAIHSDATREGRRVSATSDRDASAAHARISAAIAAGDAEAARRTMAEHLSAETRALLRRHLPEPETGTGWWRSG